MLNARKAWDRYISEDDVWYTSRKVSEEALEFLDLLKSVKLNSGLVLDIGAGSCSDTRWFNEEGIKALSLDIRGEAKILGDCRNLPIQSHSAGSVFCRGMLHILSSQNQIEAILEMHRVLVVGGLIYLTFMESIYVDEEFPLVTVDYHFGMDLQKYFNGTWSLKEKVNHGDHRHNFGKFIGIRR